MEIGVNCANHLAPDSLDSRLYPYKGSETVVGGSMAGCVDGHFKSLNGRLSSQGLSEGHRVGDVGLELGGGVAGSAEEGGEDGWCTLLDVDLGCFPVEGPVADGGLGSLVAGLGALGLESAAIRHVVLDLLVAVSPLGSGEESRDGFAGAMPRWECGCSEDVLQPRGRPSLADDNALLSGSREGWGASGEGRGRLSSVVVGERAVGLESNAL